MMMVMMTMVSLETHLPHITQRLHLPWRTTQHVTLKLSLDIITLSAHKRNSLQRNPFLHLICQILEAQAGLVDIRAATVCPNHRSGRWELVFLFSSTNLQVHVSCIKC